MLGMTKYCTQCGRKVPDRYRFCDRCRAPITSESPTRPSSTKPERPPSVTLQKLGKTITLTTIVLLLVGLAVGSIVGAAFVTLTSTRLNTTTVTIAQQSKTVTQSTGTTKTVTQSLQLHNINVTSQGQTNILSYIPCILSGSDCASVAIYWIGRANISIHLLTYRLTGTGLREALIQAKNRGVEVRIVLNAGNAAAQGSEYQNLKDAHVDVRLNNDSVPTYDNVAVIDNRIVMTGSYNWTTDANHQDLIVIADKTWALAFDSEFMSVYSTAS